MLDWDQMSWKERLLHVLVMMFLDLFMIILMATFFILLMAARGKLEVSVSC